MIMMKHLSSKIALTIVVGMLLALITGIGIMYKNTNEAVETAVADYGIDLAKNISKSINVDVYEQFLQDQTDQKAYWKLREPLNDIRIKTGAFYVYTLKADSGNKKVSLWIDGLPKDATNAAKPGDPTTTTTFADIEPALNGDTSHTSIVKDEEYGDYMSVFAPIKKDGKVIGVLGVDINASQVKAIESEVNQSILPMSITSNVAIILIVVGGMTWFLRRKLKPLQTISLAAEKMASGDLLFAKELMNSLTIKGEDEIKQVANSFKHMTNNTIEVIREMNDSSNELLSMTKDIDTKINDANHSNSKIVEGMHHVATSTETQIRLSDESVRAIDEMAIGIQQIAESASGVSEKSSEATNELQSGYREIQSIINHIEGIKATVHNSADVIEQLGLQANEISSIVTIITGIADQTNLLALNAAIEAARAGEHGKGFAVVSEEVRNLAEESKKSAEQIAERLTTFKKTIDQAVVNMEKGTTDVETSAVAINQAGEKFVTIIHSIEAVSTDIESVSAITEEMSASSEEVAASIQEFVSLLRETANITNRVAAATDQQEHAMQTINKLTNALTTLSSRLELVVEKFKI